jgi:hypothetical protein
VTAPPMQRVRSSVLRSFGYVPLAPKFRESAADIGADGFLFVDLRNGGTYAHLVPSWVVGLLSQRRISAGRVWNRHVRGRRGLRIA